MNDLEVEVYLRRMCVPPITWICLNLVRQRGFNHWFAKNLIHQVSGEMQFCCSSGICYALCVYFWLMFIVFCRNWIGRSKRWYGEFFTKMLRKEEKLKVWTSLEAIPLSQYSRIWNSRKLLISSPRLFWSSAQILALWREITRGLLWVNTEMCIRGTQKLQWELSGAVNKLGFLACPSCRPLQTHRAFIWGCRDAYSSKSVIVCSGC